MTEERKKAPLPFLVLALPRSRTAWLAHYLGYRGRYLVGHDISIECNSPEDFTNSYKFGMNGTVETGAVIAWRLIRHVMPQMRLLVVHRPLGEITASIRAKGFEPDVRELEERQAMLAACAREPDVHAIMASDLSDPTCARWVFEYLLDCDWDESWYETLITLNIQVDFQARITQLARNHDKLLALQAAIQRESHERGVLNGLH